MLGFNPRTIILGGLVLALVAGGAWWYSQRQSSAPNVLRASGMIEATEVRLASEFGGRLETRPVREGQLIKAGTVVATFDTDLLEHQIQIADPATRTHLERQLDRQTLVAPRDGLVLRTVFEPGEQVPPGAPVAVLGDLRNLTLKVYLPEDRYGQVTVGERADVTVDSFPGVLFPSRVDTVASEAEFTPRNVQTQDDRVKSVYAIKLRLANADLRLKPGMFADAAFAGGR